jgi:CheY-like chemotaxis protein
MDPETLQRAFDPFFTTKEPGRGTGLGLSVVHGIVHAHNGAISVHSTPGAGTRFDLYLPASMLRPEPVPHPTPSHVQAPAPSGIQRGNGQRILFIDDEGPIVRTCSSALRRFGYTVASFTSPTEALLEFHAHPEAFQLVITDFSMPQKSGTDVAREILQVRPDLPLIITSGFISEQMQREIHAAGIRHVLRKPATLEELSVAVHHALHPDAHA